MTLIYPKESEACDGLIAAGALFHQRGWVPATGGNFSALLDAETMLITASGQHKGELSADSFLRADLAGRPHDARRKASYETGLHTQIYRWARETGQAIGAVLHTHSRANTVLSRRFAEVRLQHYELQKVLPGAPDPSTITTVPVFENDQDIGRLAERVHTHLLIARDAPGYLIAGHGLYTWGRTIASARHRVEALEFMLDCHLTEALLTP